MPPEKIIARIVREALEWLERFEASINTGREEVEHA
tara:strand:+ start:73 stop:180 length:108 start_codon:yes stop_codon:yes gene_type:complete